jgi:hypothetical protein
MTEKQVTKTISPDQSTIDFIELLQAAEGITFTAAVEKVTRIAKAEIEGSTGYELSESKYIPIAITSNLGRNLSHWLKESCILQARILTELEKINKREA